MKRKKFTRKTRNLALMVAVALSCSVAPWGSALAADQAEAAEQFAISISGGKEQTDPALPYFQNRSLMTTVAAVSSDSPGFVLMDKNSADITVDKYTGTAGVYVYTHDSANPATIYGGKLTIVSAGKDAAGQQAFVTLRTDSSGINFGDKTTVSAVLNALAQKLTYKNYVKVNGNERNLTGAVEIAEGLTQASLTMRKGTLSFETATGVGRVAGTPIGYNNFTTVLTGDEQKDTQYKLYIKKNPDSTTDFRQVEYVVEGYTTIAPAVTSTAAGGNFAAIMPAAGKEFFVNSGSSGNTLLTLDLTGIKTNGGKVYGIYNNQAAGTDVYCYGGLNIVGTTDGTYAGGVFAGNANGQGASTVNLNVTTLNVNGTGSDFAGIKAIKNGVINSAAILNIVTDGGYGVVAENGGVVNLNLSQRADSAINANGKVALYAKDGGKITFTGAGLINGDAVAEGDGSSIDITLGYGAYPGTWNGNAIGHVNVDLVKPAQAWQGRFDSDGTLSVASGSWDGNIVRDGASLVLLDKVKWTGAMQAAGKLTLSGRSNWVNTGDKEATLKSFTGATIDGLKGSITSGAADLTIDKYSGMAAVYYTHDAANPTNIQGGRVTIKAADKDAAITLRTDSAGIDLANDAVVKNVLNSLAQKLTYSAYITGETNLAGYAEIAEGLTAGALSYRVSEITFNKATGAGGVTNAGLAPFNAVITGDSVKDKAFVDRGVLSVSGNTSTYNFTQDTIINNSVDIEGATPDPGNMKYAVAVTPDATKDIVLNMNGHNLTIKNNIGQGKMAQSTSAVLYALNSDTSITINNPGAIDLSTYSQSYYAGGIAAGKQNITDNYPCEVTINNDNSWDHAVRIRGVMGMGGVGSGSIFNINWTAMKAFQHGHIVIKGLVDLESYGAWCLSAIGNDGYINLGGGRIVSRNYPSIDAYGDGTVNINVSGSGDTLAAGSNDVIIEGNLKATGQWVGAGSPGHINVALTNSKSYLAGLADNTAAGGTINLFLQNGATWINRDGGFSYGAGVSLGNDAESRVTNFYGGNSEAGRGLIAQKQTGTLTIDNYQGHALAYYEHDATDPAKILGGYLEITSAVKTGNDNAVITLRTDNSGINVEDKALVTKVLDNLASRLSYTNYMTGERSLTGYAEIAEGLTSSKIFQQQSIIFDENTGVGRVSANPLGQMETSFDVSITGDLDKAYRKAGTLIDGKYVFDKATVIKLGAKSTSDAFNMIAVQTYTSTAQGPYKQVNIEAKNGLRIDGTPITNLGTKAGIYSGNGTELTIDGNVDIDLINESNSTRIVGIVQDLKGNVAGAQAIATINGNLAMDIDYPPGVAGLASTPRAEKVAGILNKEANGSIININGLVDFHINGTGVIADCPVDASGVINLKGGRILTTKNEAVNNHALTAYSGAVNLNMTTGQPQTLAAQALAAAALTPGNTKVEVEGNILTMKNTATSATSNNLLDGTVNMALTTGESYWKGVADNAGADKLGTFNLYLKNGALWINDSQGKTYNQTNAGVLQGVFDNISHVTSFTGGDSDATRGIIQQKSNTGIAIDNYSGNTMVIYGHNSQNPAEIIGGGLRIEKAATGSAITLMTDSSGINVAEENTVNEVLNALAGKLTYDGYQTAKANLTGKVAIGEGLTAPGILWKVGDIEFNSATGSLASGSVITPDNPIEYGQYETMVMSGAKSAMVSSAMLWRTENNDLQKRLGELRLSPENGGIWANVYGGKSKYDQNNTRYSTSYKAVQIGYDKEVNSGWRVGAAVSHTDGDSDYILGGRGDNTATSLSLYGSWQGDKGHYSDIVLKGGQIKNDFTVYNEMGHKVEGDYKTNGLSVSAEYGRRIEYGKGLYVEPQMQLSWGRLQGKDYTATSDVKDGAGNYRTMNISQDGFTSLVGRIGVGVGRLTEKSSIYAKAFLAHEFSGDFSSRFIAEEAKKSRVDLGGSWAVFQLGGSTKVSNNAYAYANLEKSVGGDVATEWRLDAGMRWSF
ncbi:autotransporter outer membrane beta-barrel domain-containing protein [Sporomusa aerivorans]|uniref:autotransporter outer membrane beta-barrel domain-containing protein n=1 Tax=Sporomusa aerivorans TaxID=204936 RepID=UPI00352AB699